MPCFFEVVDYSYLGCDCRVTFPIPFYLLKIREKHSEVSFFLGQRWRWRLHGFCLFILGTLSVSFFYWIRTLYLFILIRSLLKIGSTFLVYCQWKGHRTEKWILSIANVLNYSVVNKYVWLFFSISLYIITGSERVFNVLTKICKGHRIIVILSIDYWDHFAWFQLAQSFLCAKGGLPVF